MKYLAKKTDNAMTRHALQDISVSELEGHRIVEMARVEMTLQEKVGDPYSLNRSNKKKILRALYVAVRIELHISFDLE